MKKGNEYRSRKTSSNKDNVQVIRIYIEWYFLNFCPEIPLKRYYPNFGQLAREINSFLLQEGTVSDDEFIKEEYLLKVYFDPPRNYRLKFLLYILNFFQNKYAKEHWRYPLSKEKSDEIKPLFSKPSEESLQDQNPQYLPLSLFTEHNYTIKTLFKSRYIPLLGRTQELKLLRCFWDQPTPFAWWMITAQGGMGKSKIALTFCEEITKQKAHAGFLDTSLIANVDWISWQPAKDTFIVFDYASFNIHSVIKTIKLLSTKCLRFKHKVRILLLERETKGQWQEVLNSEIKLQTITPWTNPYELGGISEKDILVDIIRSVCEKEKIDDVRIIENIISRYKKLQTSTIPLYIIISILLLIHEVDFNGKTKHEIISLYFSREEKLLESKFGKNNLLVEKHKNLAAIATLLRGLNEKQLYEILSTNSEWFPTIKEFNESLLINYCPIFKNSKGYQLGFVEPDIVGEYFVWNCLASGYTNTFIKDVRIRDIVEIAWKLDKAYTAIFFNKLYDDYSELRVDIGAFFLLMDINDVSFLKMFISCVKTDFYDNKYHFAVSQHKTLSAFYRKYPISEVLPDILVFTERLMQYCIDSSSNINYLYNEIEWLEEYVPQEEYAFYKINAIKNCIKHFSVYDEIKTKYLIDKAKNLIQKHDLQDNFSDFDYYQTKAEEQIEARKNLTSQTKEFEDFIDSCKGNFSSSVIIESYLKKLRGLVGVHIMLREYAQADYYLQHYKKIQIDSLNPYWKDNILEPISFVITQFINAGKFEIAITNLNYIQSICEQYPLIDFLEVKCQIISDFIKSEISKKEKLKFFDEFIEAKNKENSLQIEMLHSSILLYFSGEKVYNPVAFSDILLKFIDNPERIYSLPRPIAYLQHIYSHTIDCIFDNIGFTITKHLGFNKQILPFSILTRLYSALKQLKEITGNKSKYIQYCLDMFDEENNFELREVKWKKW